jgi:acetyltransferase-like isoleucine patch superfamily enzyme
MRWYPGDRTLVDLKAESVFRSLGTSYIGAGCAIWLREGATLQLGDRTAINPRSELSVATAVTIGSGCAIGWKVTILDHDHHRLVGPARYSRDRGPIAIGDHVWIGTGVTILKGVTIGDGAVVAARSVVTRDVPSRAIVAGAPAEVVRRDAMWEL